MLANRLNVVVMVLAIAFLMAESGNAQVDGFPQSSFNPKRGGTVSTPQRYCGKKLSNALQIVCDGVYNSMFKKSGQGEYIDPRWRRTSPGNTLVETRSFPISA